MNRGQLDMHVALSKLHVPRPRPVALFRRVHRVQVGTFMKSHTRTYATRARAREKHTFLPGLNSSTR